MKNLSLTALWVTLLFMGGKAYSQTAQSVAQSGTSQNKYKKDVTFCEDSVSCVNMCDIMYNHDSQDNRRVHTSAYYDCKEKLTTELTQNIYHKAYRPLIDIKNRKSFSLNELDLDSLELFLLVDSRGFTNIFDKMGYDHSGRLMSAVLESPKVIDIIIEEDHQNDILYSFFDQSATHDIKLVPEPPMGLDIFGQISFRFSNMISQVTGNSCRGYYKSFGPYKHIEILDDNSCFLKATSSILDIDEGSSFIEKLVSQNNQEAMHWFMDYVRFDSYTSCADISEKAEKCLKQYCHLGATMDANLRKDWMNYEAFQDYIDDVIKYKVNAVTAKSPVQAPQGRWCAEGATHHDCEGKIIKDITDVNDWVTDLCGNLSQTI